MRNRTAAAGWVLAVAVILLLPSRSLADSGALSVSSPLTASQGSSFTVDVNIANVSDLYDFQLDLTFNPAVLQATNVLEGAFLPTGGATFLIPGFTDNVGGRVTFNADTLLSATPGVSGSGILLEFDFTPFSAGTSSLDLGNIYIVARLKRRRDC